MMEKSFQAFLTNVTNVVKETPLKVGDVCTVREIPKVFLDDFLELSSPQGIDFKIKLVIGIELISKAHTKLKELKN